MSSARRLKTAEPPLSPISVPQLLRDIPRWICWDYMDYGDGKKPRKVPISPNGDYGVNYNDPSAWRPFEDVMREAKERGGLGVGFVFSEDDDIIGVDLDNAYDEQAWLKPWAREIAKVFSGAFCEQTPSGLGLHFIGLSSKINGRTRVELPDGDGGIERYSENRWFTFTGLPVCEGDVVDVRSAMVWLEDNYFGGAATARPESPSFPADIELDIELARVCLEHIGRNRASIGDDWRAVGYACKGTSESLRDEWIRWSAQWPDFSLAECADRWSRFDSRSGVGTLVYMATADSGISSHHLREQAAARLGRNTGPRLEPSENKTPTLCDAIQAWIDQEDVPALPTGIESLDRLFDGGLPLGQMTAIAGSPGVGKSALALQVGIQCLARDQSLNAAWCLGEMSRAALAARAITCWGGASHDLSLQQIIRKEGESRGIATTLADAIGERMKLIDPKLTIDKIELAVKKDGIRLLIIDYLQLVHDTVSHQSKTEEINSVLLRLRELTSTLNIATLLVVNIAKGVDHNTEIGNIGKGSNQIDFDADSLLFGQRTQEEGANGEVKIIWHCKKLRQGERKDVELWFQGKYQTFDDVLVGEIPEFTSVNWGSIDG